MRHTCMWKGLVVLVVPMMLMGSGPGVHVREADLAFQELLAQQPDVWQPVADAPLGLTFLRLGAVSPDFQWMTDELTFGHSKALSHHLIQEATASQDPVKLAFALGHMAHQLSDAAMESFMVPTFMGRAQLGMTAIYQDDPGPRGEGESHMEGFGDLILGDWHSIIDVLYDTWLGTPESRALSLEMVQWYCQTGNAYLNAGNDCDLVVAGMVEKLDLLDQYLGGFNRSQAHALANTIILQPLPDLAQMLAGGELIEMVGQIATPGVWSAWDLQRFRESEFCQDAFWDLYFDEMIHLGVTWTTQTVLGGTAGGGFPGWEPNAMIGGSIRSLMRFLPDVYEVTPHLIVKSVSWLGPASEPRTSVSSADQGAAFTLRLAFYASRPLTDTVRAVVLRDAPGIDRSQDTVVAEASLDVAIDPLTYVTQSASLLEVPFLVDLQDSVGFYVEIYLGDQQKPTFTTNWDQLYTITDVDVSRELYRNNYGSYGFWPPSLGRTDPPSFAASTVLVSLRQSPVGFPVTASAVTLVPATPDEPLTVLTNAGGVAVFEGLPPGMTYDVVADAPVEAWHQASSGQVTTQPGQVHWVLLQAERRVEPQVESAWWNPKECVPVTWNAPDFAGVAKAWQVRALDAQEVELPGTFKETALEEGELCGLGGLDDGTLVRASVTPVYVTDATGTAGLSVEFGLDKTPPAQESLTVEGHEGGYWPCSGCEPGVYPIDLSLSLAVLEPHAPLLSASLLCEGVATDVVLDVQGPDAEGRWLVTGNVECSVCGASVDSPGKLAVQVVNQAGLSLLVPFEERPVEEVEGCMEIGPELEEDVVVQIDDTPDDVSKEDLTQETVGMDVAGDAPDAANQTDAAVADAAADVTGSGPGSSSGCAAGSDSRGHGLLPLLLLGWLLVIRRRRAE